ncbi:MAG: hypothetical protein QM687_06185 [Ferruginibacter sp.]
MTKVSEENTAQQEAVKKMLEKCRTCPDELLSLLSSFPFACQEDIVIDLSKDTLYWLIANTRMREDKYEALCRLAEYELKKR